MIKVNIIPMSVNRAWKGRRFRTPEYNKYERDLMLLLPKSTLPKPPYEMFIEWGFSNYASDVDNPLKNFTDVLQKKYKFNDKDIITAHIRKMIVPKGKEYILFDIITHDGRRGF